MKIFFKRLFEYEDTFEVAGFFAMSSFAFMLLALGIWIIRISIVCPCQ